MATTASMSNRLTIKDIVKAIGIGILTAVLLSAIMVPAFKMGISPMPKPVALAFAQALLGKVPLPVGLLFHVAYVTAVVVLYVALFRHRITFKNALGYGLVLWVVALVIFFPIIGWGLLGLGVGPKLIIASLIPHVLFALFLWGLGRWAFGSPQH
jgi:hypothetical protein